MLFELSCAIVKCFPLREQFYMFTLFLDEKSFQHFDELMESDQSSDTERRTTKGNLIKLYLYYFYNFASV